MNQPESMNPGLTWPAPLGLGGLQLQASASRSISQKMSLQITVNFQTQVIFRITPCVFVFPDLSFWAIPNCHNASGDYEVLPVVLPSFLCRVDFTQDHVLKDLIAIFDEHSDEPRVSGILPLAKTGWWPNNHPVAAWNKEETHGTLEHRLHFDPIQCSGPGVEIFWGQWWSVPKSPRDTLNPALCSACSTPMMTPRLGMWGYLNCKVVGVFLAQWLRLKVQIKPKGDA